MILKSIDFFFFSTNHTKHSTDWLWRVCTRYRKWSRSIDDKPLSESLDLHGETLWKNICDGSIKCESKPNLYFGTNIKRHICHWRRIQRQNEPFRFIRTRIWFEKSFQWKFNLLTRFSNPMQGWWIHFRSSVCEWNGKRRFVVLYKRRF